jgi:hypothetical protein
MFDTALKCFDLMPGVAFVPEPVELLGGDPELDDKVAGEVLRLDLPALLPPEAEEGGFIATHDNASVGPADERAPLDDFNLPAHVAHLSNECAASYSWITFYQHWMLIPWSEISVNSQC